MEKFIETIEKEAEKKLSTLEHSHLNVLKNSLEASLVLDKCLSTIERIY